MKDRELLSRSVKALTFLAKQLKVDQVPEFVTLIGDLKSQIEMSDEARKKQQKDELKRERMRKAYADRVRREKQLTDTEEFSRRFAKAKDLRSGGVPLYVACEVSGITLAQFHRRNDLERGYQ